MNTNIETHAQIEMEQNKLVNGQQEASRSGAGSIQNGGETNHQDAAATVAARGGGGESRVAAVASAGGYSSGLAAGGGPSTYAAAVGAPSGYAAAGPSRVVAGTADGGPNGVAGHSSESATGKRKRNYRHSPEQISAMEA